MKWWDKIMTLVGLDFDPDRDGVRPPGDPDGQVRTVKPRQKDPDGVRPVGHTGLKYKELDTDNKDTAAWDQYSGRNYELTDMDRAVISDRNLDLGKYTAFKFLWSSKRSDGKFHTATSASRKLSSDLGRGYGKRTAEQYFSAINYAHQGPTPLSGDGGGDRKKPQNDGGDLQSIVF